MLKLDQDRFITDFVTTFLATKAANDYERLKLGELPAGDKGPAFSRLSMPVGDAIILARTAWYRILEHGEGFAYRTW